MKKRIIIYVAVGLCLLVGGIIFFMIADRNTNIAVNSNSDDVESGTESEKSAAERERKEENLEILRTILGDIYTDEEILNGGKSEGGDQDVEDTTDDVVDEPTITVLTEFPEGETKEEMVDVEYVVTPSKGAWIEEIYCLINGNIKSWIYSVNEGDDEVKLSKTKLLLTYGENDIVFYVVDSHNKTAQFRVKNKPYLLERETPRFDENNLRPSKHGDGYQYVNNWLFIDFNTDITEDRLQKIIDTVDGEIAGEGVLDSYFIRIPESTEEEIEKMCERLENDNEDIISYAEVFIVADAELMYASTNDPWWTEEPERDSNSALDEQKTRTADDANEVILTAMS